MEVELEEQEFLLRRLMKLGGGAGLARGVGRGKGEIQPGGGGGPVRVEGGW